MTQFISNAHKFKDSSALIYINCLTFHISNLILTLINEIWITMNTLVTVINLQMYYQIIYFLLIFIQSSTYLIKFLSNEWKFKIIMQKQLDHNSEQFYCIIYTLFDKIHASIDFFLIFHAKMEEILSCLKFWYLNSIKSNSSWMRNCK